MRLVRVTYTLLRLATFIIYKTVFYTKAIKCQLCKLLAKFRLLGIQSDKYLGNLQDGTEASNILQHRKR